MTSAVRFAIWITGLPASGKSTITRELVQQLAAAGIVPAVLESDELRKILSPEGNYSPAGRDRFYRQMALIGAMLVRSGIPVIIDATANRSAYRDHLRSLVRQFVEVHVACPLETCISRDPKGIYAAAAAGRSKNVPGIQAPYEPPLSPEVTVTCDEAPYAAALRIMRKLGELEYL
jgi:adenylylsulfate kinase